MIKKIVRLKVIKYVLKIILSCALIIYLFFAPVLVIKPLKVKQSLVNSEIQVDYMGILELWNIDTFEGGSVSRTAFLEKMALKFERQNKGVFIMVSNMTKEQALLNLNNGLLPDLVSFGVGIGSDFKDYLVEIKTDKAVRNDLLNGGKKNNKQFAIPYLFGGYAVFNENEYQKEKTMGFGLKSNNNPLLCLIQNDLINENYYQYNNEQDSFDAYDKYLSKQFEALCGTGRDLYRITNRIKNGNMTSRSILYLSNFTDLVQYIAVCNTDLQKQNVAKKFVDFLLDDYAQSYIQNINMFSVVKNNLYSIDEFAQMEKALSKDLKTISVFSSDQDLYEIKQLCIKIASGDDSLKAQLKKYLI